MNQSSSRVNFRRTDKGLITFAAQKCRERGEKAGGRESDETFIGHRKTAKIASILPITYKDSPRAAA
jgi:hypothetical protein